MPCIILSHGKKNSKANEEKIYSSDNTHSYKHGHTFGKNHILSTKIVGATIKTFEHCTFTKSCQKIILNKSLHIK